MIPVFCFIDDADFELDNFRVNAADAFKGVEFVYARNFGDAERKLDQRPCHCFLLDIYGAENGCDDNGLPPQDKIESALDGASGAAGLYEELPPGNGERGNAFLRRLYARVQAAQDVFSQCATDLGQGPGFGLHNLAQVREQHPFAAALGYSRKAFYADAAAMTMAGADGVLQKPQGSNEEAIARATKEQAPGLARACYAAVDQRMALAAGILGMRFCQDGVGLNLVDALQGAVLHLAPGPEYPPSDTPQEAAKRLMQPLMEGCDLPGGDKELLMAVADWLGREK